jgi:HK97 family phage portal protein
MPILHLKLFNPLNDHYGMSPAEAAAAAIDIHNASADWGKALLDNGARPSGALIYKGSDSAPNLTDLEFQRLKEELEAQYSGARNAGRPLLLEGGLEWRPLSLSPEEMDLSGVRYAAAREIALAFGVPPMLLGIPGDATYNNYREANLAFWRQTALPLVARTAQALTNWLRPRFGSNLRLSFDADAVDALNAEREALWSRVGNADYLTTDEKRAAVGYGKLEG